jgi:4-hydroxy-tetrahydrodipicolinate reductase
MKIALIGFGKMGKEIEKIALSKGYEITLKVTSSNTDFTAKDLQGTDVAIEFSRPEYAISNIKKCFEANVPVVVGTTGWYEQFDQIRSLCLENKQALLYATNFSVGVNIFFKINTMLAKFMNNQPQYAIEVEEIHHTQKLDAPSGTGISLAEQIIENNDNLDSWKNELTDTKNELPIVSKRIDKVPGTHEVIYKSGVDTIEIKHTAHNRSGFAQGALLAAEWLADKEGVFTMDDVLSL